MNIEVEIRSFIDEKKFSELLDFFNANAKLTLDDYQETFYFDAPVDIRIQKNNFFAKIWMKQGKIHDEAREELEIKFDRNDFESLKKMFSTLGYKVKIKWFRDRKQFDWEGITVCLDYTRGYGYIIELEKMCSAEEKDSALELLKTKLADLNVPLTSREKFDEAFSNYQNNWARLILE